MTADQVTAITAVAIWVVICIGLSYVLGALKALDDTLHRLLTALQTQSEHLTEIKSGVSEIGTHP